MVRNRPKSRLPGEQSRSVGVEEGFVVDQGRFEKDRWHVTRSTSPSAQGSLVGRLSDEVCQSAGPGRTRGDGVRYFVDQSDKASNRVEHYS